VVENTSALIIYIERGRIVYNAEKWWPTKNKWLRNSAQGISKTKEDVREVSLSRWSTIVVGRSVSTAVVPLKAKIEKNTRRSSAP